MPAPSVKPKKVEEEPSEARGSNNPPRSHPVLPLAESSSHPSSRAASRAGTPVHTPRSRACSTAPSIAPT
eukprot:2459980-Amphidinium_carterae.1